MLIDKLLRKKALTYTHVCYRNTFIEDLHSVSHKLDMNIYKDVDSFVSEKIALLQRYRKYADMVFTTPTKLLAPGMDIPAEAKELLLDVMYNTLMGSDWYAAEACEYYDTAPAEYILSGKFREFCLLGEKLTDKNMKIINIDIHNRFYTLLLHNVL